MESMADAIPRLIVQGLLDLDSDKDNVFTPSLAILGQ